MNRYIWRGQSGEENGGLRWVVERGGVREMDEEACRSAREKLTRIGQVSGPQLRWTC